MTPVAWAAASAPAIWTAICRASAMGNGDPRASGSGQPLLQRFAIDEFEQQKLHDTQRVAGVGFFEPVDRPDLGMVERGEHLRLAGEPRDAIRIAGEAARQRLQRDISAEFAIARAVDFAHSACRNRRHDLVRAQARTRLQRHVERGFAPARPAGGGTGSEKT